MRAGESDWALLSNRLLLLQEIMVGLSAYPPDGVFERAAEGVGWIFDGGTLRRYRPGELSPTPPVTRGRGRVGDLGEVFRHGTRGGHGVGAHGLVAGGAQGELLVALDRERQQDEELDAGRQGHV